MLIGFNLSIPLESGRGKSLAEFMEKFGLLCIEGQFTNISHTYERDDGLVTSWPGHFLASSSIHLIMYNSNCNKYLRLYLLTFYFSSCWSG